MVARFNFQDEVRGSQIIICADDDGRVSHQALVSVTLNLVWILVLDWSADSLLTKTTTKQRQTNWQLNQEQHRWFTDEITIKSL